MSAVLFNLENSDSTLFKLSYSQYESCFKKCSDSVDYLNINEVLTLIFSENVSSNYEVVKSSDWHSTIYLRPTNKTSTINRSFNVLKNYKDPYKAEFIKFFMHTNKAIKRGLDPDRFYLAVQKDGREYIAWKCTISKYGFHFGASDNEPNSLESHIIMASDWRNSGMGDPTGCIRKDSLLKEMSIEEINLEFEKRKNA